MRGSIAPTGRCMACDKSLEGRRADALTCSSACRQRFYNARKRYAQLTAETRELIRILIDLRRRERIARAGGYAAIERDQQARGQEAA